MKKMLFKKNEILGLCVLAIFCISLASCGSSKKILWDESNFAVSDLSKTVGEGTFVILKDSSKVRFTTLTEDDKLLKKPELVLDGNLRIPISNVIGVKFDNSYLISRYISPLGFTSHVGGLNFGSFATLINSGRLNMYKRSYIVIRDYSGRSSSPFTSPFARRDTTKVYYIQRGNEPLIRATDKNIRRMVSDHEPSKEIVTQYFKKKNTLRAIGVANTLLGAAFAVATLAKSVDDSNGKSTAPNVTATLTLASIGYGFLNRKFLKQNTAKLNLAYEEYNAPRK